MHLCLRQLGPHAIRRVQPWRRVCEHLQLACRLAAALTLESWLGRECMAELSFSNWSSTKCRKDVLRSVPLTSASFSNVSSLNPAGLMTQVLKEAGSQHSYSQSKPPSNSENAFLQLVQGVLDMMRNVAGNVAGSPWADSN